MRIECEKLERDGNSKEYKSGKDRPVWSGGAHRAEIQSPFQRGSVREVESRWSQGQEYMPSTERERDNVGGSREWREVARLTYSSDAWGLRLDYARGLADAREFMICVGVPGFDKRSARG
jgi:hypothetical protein